MVMEANAAESAQPVAAPTAEEVRAKLRVARPGLRFSEVMTGMITMGVTDPVEGYENDAAIAMRLHATVTVPNLPGFIKDPNHKGEWRAAGSIPVLGDNVIAMGNGDFGLFRRAIREGKGVRELVYDTEFSVGGQQFRMRGRKYVEPSPPWRMWPATTTLYVQLFPASGTAGQPVAAGVLRLTLWSFIRQLLTDAGHRQLRSCSTGGATSCRSIGSLCRLCQHLHQVPPVVSGEDRADVVIVGSGFGGAVAACRLAATGRSVVVLERGRDWSKTRTPQRPRDYLYSNRMPHRLNGWLDIRFLDQMVVATGAGVGGGSLIYANVCVDAPDRVFYSGWPSPITAAVMKAITARSPKYSSRRRFRQGRSIHGWRCLARRQPQWAWRRGISLSRWLWRSTRPRRTGAVSRGAIPVCISPANACIAGTV